MDTALSGFFGLLHDAVSGANTVQLGVNSFIDAGTDRIPALFTRAISVNLSDTIFDSQRRRLPGRGS
jgi:hypothetical protein